MNSKLDSRMEEFLDNLPQIREMYKQVPAIPLATEILKPNESYLTGSRYQILTEVPVASHFLEVLGADPEEKDAELYQLVVYGAAFVIKNLLAYTEHLESKLAEV